MTFSISDVAASCSRASSNSRLSRATFVFSLVTEELRRRAALGAWPAPRRCALFLFRPDCPRRLMVAPEGQTRDGSNLQRYSERVDRGLMSTLGHKRTHIHAAQI